MYELSQYLMSITGPIPHLCLFATIGTCLGWWTRGEIRATMSILIVMSIGAECLQLAWPHIFSFEVMDIVWNIAGSALGILIAQAGHFITSELWFRREKGWNTIEGDMHRGKYSR